MVWGEESRIWDVGLFVMGFYKRIDETETLALGDRRGEGTVFLF